MIIQPGTKMRIRLRQEPANVYDGEVREIRTPRGKLLPALDLEERIPRRTRVGCQVAFHAGQRNCVLGGTVAAGYDEIWTFAPDLDTQRRLQALVQVAGDDPVQRDEALQLLRELVVGIQATARQHGDTEGLARYGGDPDARAEALLSGWLPPR